MRAKQSKATTITKNTYLNEMHPRLKEEEIEQRQQTKKKRTGNNDVIQL